MNKRYCLITIAAAVLLAVCPGSKAGAAGVTIAPAYKDVTIRDQQFVEVPIQLANSSDRAMTFAVEVRDFGALDDSGGVSVSSGNRANKYGLKDYVTLDVSQLVIEPKKRGKVIATISNAASLSPGGHYGAVVFTLQDASGSGHIPVKQEIASLLFVAKEGGDGPKLSTAKMDFQTSLFSLPREVDIVIANDGNVHATPSGTLQLKDPRGRTLFSSPINSANGKVLPETVRKFVLGVSTTKRLLVPGRYTLEVVSNGVTARRQFMLVPLASLPIIAGGLALLGMACFVLRKRGSWLYRKIRPKA